jgi:hypothetical protein
MEQTESDKDRFLKAARLERHEHDRRYDMQRLEMLLNYLVGILAMMGCFALMAWLFYLMSGR